MSHQDRKSRTRLNAQDLMKAVNALLPARLFNGIRFRGDSKWSPFSLALNCLFWGWSSEDKITDRFEHAQEVINVLFDGQEQLGTSYRGFTKRMARWHEDLIQPIKSHFQNHMLEKFDERISGYRVFAVDGSRVDIPQTEANEAALGGRAEKNRNLTKATKGKPVGRRKATRQSRASKSKKRKTAQVWLTTIWHPVSGLPWDWRRGPGHSSERAHLMEMLDGLPTETLMTADAGFVGYENWRAMMDRNIAFVIRVGANLRLLRNLCHAEKRQNIVYCWTEDAMNKKLPPLKLRLVKVCVKVKKKERKNGKKRTVTKTKTIYLVTNVLSTNRLPDRAVIQIYRKRWGVEVFYRSLKQTFQRTKLKSRSPGNVTMELDWSLIALWSVCLYAATHHTKLGNRLDRISVSNVLRALRKTIRNVSKPTKKSQRLDDLITLALKDDYKRKTDKSKRPHPSKKKKRVIGLPTICRANSDQKKLAKEILNAKSGKNASLANAS